ncbi:hypothetical protein HK405_013211, partial [Cladochytrium tenue]
SFSNVTVAVDNGNAIDIPSFLEACEGLLSVFDSLGSAFSIIKSDIQGNITKIRTKHQSDVSRFATLQSIVEGEMGDKADKKKTATEGLLWLKRTLEFTAKGLRLNKSNPAEELSTSFTAAYGQTLAPFHGFLIRPIFSMAMKACPSRNDFYAKLGAGAPGFDDGFEDWLSGLESRVDILVQLYTRM